MPTYEKMSKSRGNVITVDEVVCGVQDLASGHEFRDESNRVIDWRSLAVWRHPHTGMYWTATRFGKRPVFLHGEGNPVPAMLLIDGVETLQHEWHEAFWMLMLDQYEADGSDCQARPKTP